MHDREPEPGAVGLGGVKRLKYLVTLGGGDAFAGVGDDDLEELAPFVRAVRLHSNLAAFRHRFDGVHQQIPQCLAGLGRVERDFRQVWLVVLFDPDLLRGLFLREQ